MSKLTLQQEVTLLRSAVIGLIGKDPEGEYRPEFVASTFAAMTEKPIFRFTTPEKFLAHIRRQARA